MSGLGRQLIRDLGAIGGIDRHEPHYDQLMQKLAEILVLRQLLALSWPGGTTFEHEPALTRHGKRPELKVVTPEHVYLFEVKTPSLTAHARNRAKNDLQAPARMFERDILDRLAGEGGLTLPRDNPVKDFLIDAELKFAPFKAATRATSLLVIVWDDHIYEPITVLATLGIFGLIEIDGWMPADRVSPRQDVFDRGDVDLADVAEIGHGAWRADQRPHVPGVSCGVCEIALGVVMAQGGLRGTVDHVGCYAELARPRRPLVTVCGASHQPLDHRPEVAPGEELHERDDVAFSAAAATVETLFSRVDGKAVAAAAARAGSNVLNG